MIFVTGGTGLLGAHLLYDLLQSGEAVRASRRSTSSVDLVKKIFSYYSGQAASLFSRIEWVEMDLLDMYSIEAALEGVSHVYHCAALVSFHKKDAKKMWQTNVVGTQNLVNAC